ncbi:N-6 DNA methylase [Nonomuraea sp. M3C6]|uniref:N-6 DNA methylase n=1 Tax=Nonomuraea marmarensis TaxID=3351344 RepID=A0ABW7AP48_9ACTN
MAKKRRPPKDLDQLDLFATEPEDPAPTLPAPEETIHLSGLAAAVQTPPEPEPVVEATNVLRSPRQQRARIDRIAPTSLAERIAEAWHRQHAGDGIAIPMGIVATLVLLRRTAVDGTDVAEFVLSLDKAELVKFHRHVWATLWMRQPYFVACAYPIHSWLMDEDEDLPAKVVDAIHAVTHTAITGGLFNITGDDDPAMRSDVDMLGTLLTNLRSEGARGALAEIHTPPELADMMARLLITPDDYEPGAWFAEPAAGTGGMFRAVSLAMRLQGMNPANFGWHMAELDPIATACSAVNAIVWGLGPNVLIFCGDTLVTGDTVTPAIEFRQGVLDHHHEVMSRFAIAQATRQVHALVTMLGVSD